MADGEIRIDTKIDTSGAEKGVDDLNKSMKEAANAVSSFETALKGIQSFKGIPIKELAKAAEVANPKIVQLTQRLDELQRKNATLQAAGFGLGHMEFDLNAQEIANINSKLNEYKNSLFSVNSASIAEEERLRAIRNEATMTSPQIAALTQQLEGLKARQQELQAAGVGLGFGEFDANATKIAEITAQLKAYQSSLIRTDSNTKRVTSSSIGFGNSLKNVGSGLKKGLRTLLMYGIGARTLFGIFTKLKSAIKSGLETMAQSDSGVNSALSSLSSSLATLRNALASAFAPILQYIMPVLTMFIDKLAQAATYVGMFFAALTGQSTFKKAVAVQQNYAASLSDTGAAAKEAEKNLSGLDEINTYQTNKDTGGGGGGGGGGASGGDFEEVAIPETIQNIAEKVKSVISTIKDALGDLDLEDIWELVKDIGWAFLAWKISSMFTKDLKKIIGIVMAVLGAVKLVRGFIDAWNNGLNWDNLKEMLIGAALLAGGLGLAFGHVGAAIGLLVGGIALCVIGIKDWIETGELSTEAMTAIVAGIMAIGLALSLLTGNWIILAIAAVVALVVVIIKYWDEIVAFLSGVWESIKEIAVTVWNAIAGFFSDLWEGIKEVATSVWTAISDFFTGLWDGIKEIATKVWNSISTFLTNLWNSIKKAFETVWGAYKTFFTNLWNGIKNIAVSAWNGIKSALSAAWNAIKSTVTSVFTAIKTKIQSIWNSIKSAVMSVVNGLKTALSKAWNTIKSTATSVFTKLKSTFTSIWNGIKNAFRTPINAIIGFINRLVSGVVSGINGMIGVLNRLHFDIPDWIPLIGGKSFGFNIGYLYAPQIPYLASGAVIPPNAPFTAVLGDQRNGNNIEAPESLLRQVVREESGAATYQFIAQINRKTLFDQLIEEGKMRQLMSGKNAFALD